MSPLSLVLVIALAASAFAACSVGTGDKIKYTIPNVGSGTIDIGTQYSANEAAFSGVQNLNLGVACAINIAGNLTTTATGFVQDYSSCDPVPAGAPCNTACVSSSQTLTVTWNSKCDGGQIAITGFGTFSFTVTKASGSSSAAAALVCSVFALFAALALLL